MVSDKALPFYQGLKEEDKGDLTTFMVELGLQ